MQGIYQLAVRMTVENEVSPVLRLIAHDLLHVGHRLSAATLQIGRFRLALAAAGGAWIGKTIIADLKHIIDHGGEVLRIQNQMRIGVWNGDGAARHPPRLRGVGQAPERVAARDPRHDPEDGPGHRRQGGGGAPGRAHGAHVCRHAGLVRRGEGQAVPPADHRCRARRRAVGQHPRPQALRALPGVHDAWHHAVPRHPRSARLLHGHPPGAHRGPQLVGSIPRQRVPDLHAGAWCAAGRYGVDDHAPGPRRWPHDAACAELVGPAGPHRPQQAHRRRRQRHARPVLRHQASQEPEPVPDRRGAREAPEGWGHEGHRSVHDGPGPVAAERRGAGDDPQGSHHPGGLGGDRQGQRANGRAARADDCGTAQRYSQMPNPTIE